MLAGALCGALAARCRTRCYASSAAFVPVLPPLPALPAAEPRTCSRWAAMRAVAGRAHAAFPSLIHATPTPSRPGGPHLAGAGAAEGHRRNPRPAGAQLRCAAATAAGAGWEWKRMPHSFALATLPPVASPKKLALSLPNPPHRSLPPAPILLALAGRLPVHPRHQDAQPAREAAERDSHDAGAGESRTQADGLGKGLGRQPQLRFAASAASAASAARAMSTERRWQALHMLLC